MTKLDWENITNYIDSVGTTDTIFPFAKTQSSVKVTASGARDNIIYTIGGQSGTLAPGQSVTVTGSLSSMTLRAASGRQPFQLWAVEAGTEKEEIDTSYQGQIDSLTTSLAQSMQQVGNRFTTAYDTFNRADGAINASEDGQIYLVAGDNNDCLFQVKNKKAVLGTLGNAYLSLDAGDTIETMGAEWIWENGSTLSTVAVVITNDQTLALGNLLHFITNTTGWNLQIRKGGSANQLVTVMSGTYKTPLTKDGVTKYRFEMTVQKDKNTVYLRLPDGDIQSYISTDVSLVTGTRGYWQIIRRLSTDEEPKFTSFWLTKKDATKHDHSGKENQSIFPAIMKTKDYVGDNAILKKLYSFTPTQSGWYRILSGILDTLVGSARIYTDGQYDSTITDLKIEFGSSAFNATSPTIQQIRHSSFNDGIISQIRMGNDGNNNHYLDVYIKSVTSPKTIYFEFDGFSLLKALNANAQSLFNPTANPATPTNSAVLITGKGLRTTSAIHAGAVEKEFEILTATGNVATNKSISLVDATAGNITLTLQNSTWSPYHEHTFTRTDGSANTVSIVGYFTDGTTSKTLTRGVPFKVLANPSTNQWIIV